jgi:adenine-specific DNA-methyltransferase
MSNYLKDQIITYMGNKRKLIDIIEKELEEIKKKENKEKLKIGDGFAGSGIVSRLFKKGEKELYTNDLAGYSKTLNECYLSSINKRELNKVKKYIDEANKKADEGVIDMSERWISRHWSPKDEEIKENERVYYTNKNGKRIDIMRNYIETIPEKYRSFLLGPLLVESSIHNNTNGQFGAYYKDKDGKKGEYGGKTKTDLKRITQEIRIPYPVLDDGKCKVKISQMDVNEWAKGLVDMDVVYYDPPYNKHPYNIYYFLLDVINNWNKEEEVPETNRGQSANREKSLYNSTVYAKKALEELINSTDSKYIILSYNDGGIVPIKEMDELLNKDGKEVKKIGIDHKTYNRLKGLSNYKRTGEYKGVKEYLYVIKKM